MVGVTIVMPWAPVEVKLALAVVPGMDDGLKIEPKSMRDRSGINLMSMLKHRVTRNGQVDRISPDDGSPVAAAFWEKQLDQEKASQLGQVNVTLDDMRVAEDNKALPEACDDIREPLI